MGSIGIVSLRQSMKRKMGKPTRIAVVIQVIMKQWQVAIRIIAMEMQFTMQIKMLCL